MGKSCGHDIPGAIYGDREGIVQVAVAAVPSCAVDDLAPELEAAQPVELDDGEVEAGGRVLGDPCRHDIPSGVHGDRTGRVRGIGEGAVHADLPGGRARPGDQEAASRYQRHEEPLRSA